MFSFPFYVIEHVSGETVQQRVSCVCVKVVGDGIIRLGLHEAQYHRVIR